MKPIDKLIEVLTFAFHEPQGYPEYITGHKKDIINVALHLRLNDLAKELKDDLL